MKPVLQPWAVCVRTILRNHSEGNNGASLLDELDNVTVRELDDRASVYSRDAISHVQQAAAVGGAALDDAADFMWNHWNKRGRQRGSKHFKTVAMQSKNIFSLSRYLLVSQAANASKILDLVRPVTH